MANEITVQGGLTILNGNLKYLPRAFTYRGDQVLPGGPTPGTIAVPTTGRDVDLSELTTPGVCQMTNLDDTNYVEYGVHDGSIFHPFGELLPGQPQIVRLSRNLGEEESLPGTGTTATINAFFMRANGASCNVLVECFEA